MAKGSIGGRKAYRGKMANRQTVSRDKQVARRLSALRLRIAGATYEQIGGQLGLSRTQAFRDVQSELAVLKEESAQSARHLRDLELARLDTLQLGLWKRAAGGKDTSGDPVAVAAVLRIVEMRAKLLGLNAADPRGTGDASDVETMSDARLAAIAEGADPLAVL